MRTIVVAILGVLVGAIGGHFLWRGGNDARVAGGASAADLAGIEKLHQQDAAVTMTQDPEGLVELFAQDGVRIAPDGATVVGRAAIGADNAKFRAANPGFKVLKYAPDLQHFAVAVTDGWAMESGTLTATFKMSEKDEPISMNIKTLRLLQRQADGSWKFALVELK